MINRTLSHALYQLVTDNIPFNEHFKTISNESDHAVLDGRELSGKLNQFFEEAVVNLIVSQHEYTTFNPEFLDILIYI